MIRRFACAVAAATVLVSGSPDDPATAVAAPTAGPDAAALAAAVEKGAAFLLADQQPDGGWISREYGMRSPGHGMAITAACLDALTASAPTDDAAAAAVKGVEFLKAHAADLDGDVLNDGFDFKAWGAAYGLVHLHAMTRNWPTRSKAPDVTPLIDRFAAYAARTQRPCGGWSYLTPKVDPGCEGGSVSFLTGVMTEGLALSRPKAPQIAKALDDLRAAADKDGRWQYAHHGGYESAKGDGITKEESAGRSVQIAYTLSMAGALPPKDLKPYVDAFFEVREEFVKTRTQHPHTKPFMIAGYYYYHGHAYAARAMRRMAESDPSARAELAGHVATLASSLLAEQAADGSWMDAPCGDRPYATALALLTIRDLQAMALPWAESVERAVETAKADGRPVVVLFGDGGDASRQLEKTLADAKLDALREKFVWAKCDQRADAAHWKAAKIAAAPLLAVLGAAKEYSLATTLARLPGKSTVAQIEGFLKRALTAK